MIGNVLQADLEEIIKSKNWDELRDALSELPPVDIAEVLIDLPVEDEGVIVPVLPRNLAALVFTYLPLDRQEELLHCFSNEQVRNILDQMTPDDRTRLLEETPAEVTRRLLDTLSPDELKSARILLGYPEGSAGRYMTPEYVALPPEMPAKDALEQIRRTGRGKETLNVVYIVDSEGKLLEDLRLGSLGLAPLDMKVADIEDRPLVALHATASKSEVLALFVPLIISSGGNSGSEATGLMIRSLALRELKLDDWWKVLRKEIGSGSALGGFLGFLGFLRIILWHYLGWANYHGHPYLMGVTVWASLVGVVLFGSVVGAMLPFLLRKLGFDPATSSAPFVATLVDVTGLIIYFTVAMIVLHKAFFSAPAAVPTSGPAPPGVVREK